MFKENPQGKNHYLNALLNRTVFGKDSGFKTIFCNVLSIQEKHKVYFVVPRLNNAIKMTGRFSINFTFNYKKSFPVRLRRSVRY